MFLDSKLIKIKSKVLTLTKPIISIHSLSIYIVLIIKWAENDKVTISKI